MASFLAQIVRVDRSKLAVDAGARCAIGVAIVLIAGELSGHPLTGATAAVGAINGGFASFQGTYRSRAGAVLAASLATALAAFVGGTAGHLFGPDLAITGVVGFLAGLAVALGQIPPVVGLQALVGLVVFSQFRFSTVVGLEEAGFVLAGGVVQTLLIVVVWPLRRFKEERRVLSGAFAGLAAYAGSLASDPTALLHPAVMGDVDLVLRDPQPFAGDAAVAAHRALGAQVERIRLELAALARLRQRLSLFEGESAATNVVDDLFRATANALREVGSAIGD